MDKKESMSHLEIKKLLQVSPVQVCMCVCNMYVCVYECVVHLCSVREIERKREKESYREKMCV